MDSAGSDLDMKIVSEWRIQEGDPSGLTMWFDPSREVPLLGILPLEQRRESEPAAMCQVKLELSERREVGSLEGGDAVMTQADLSSALQEPPEGFLDVLWEGDWDG